jgi:hypothetical protein
MTDRWPASHTHPETTMTIDQQLAAAAGRITELQIACADATDPDRRRQLATQLDKVRDEITRLYDLLPA